MIKINRKLKICFLIFLAYFNILVWIIVFDLTQNNLKVIFFDVGQGDSIFIETPQKHQILIDGGPDSSVLEKLGQNMPFYDRTLDLIILTHPEHDHFFGLFDVLKNYQVKNILWTGVLKNTAEFKEWERLIQEEDTQIKIARAGQRIYEDKNYSKAVDILVLYPFENLEGEEMTNVNDTSIIIKLFFKQNSFLFCGDVSKSVEHKLIDKNIDIDVDILKIAHHGSKNSTSEEFLKKVLPDLAIISVGSDNSYGHPTPEVLVLLEKYDIKLLRTDISGDISFLLK
ncbi:MAG: ComEC/Rec2 family competence protein [Patescibacteria group bacterium]|nr:MBL fold metallo-hydrolase [Patescibacteria group bacterium]MBU1876979.1 MBL fold metallo-hydrolase [Patescibacteria group bacterium]